MTISAAPTRALFLLMAIATGICVANIYYCQPLLDQMGQEFLVGVKETGWVPTLTQMGYAVGILFLVPLGDKFERKKLVLIFTSLAATCSCLLAFSSHFSVLLLASFLLGFCTMTPQVLIPFAANIAPPAERGRVVGTMMSGLLLGILLARTVSGFVGAAYGWRVMFGLAGAILFLLTLALALFLPKAEPTYQGSYVALLKSIFVIVKEQPVLRDAALFGGLLFAAFSAFWATLIYLMKSPAFDFGARSVGLFGLLGAAAALLSPYVGSIMDRRDARQTTAFMIALTMLSFVVFYFSGDSLIGLGLGVLLMDIGVQSGHISNQSRVFSILPEARSRLQTAYMFTYFVGGAAGSLLGAWCWQHYAWKGVCGGAMALLVIAMIIHIRGRHKFRPLIKPI